MVFTAVKGEGAFALPAETSSRNRARAFAARGQRSGRSGWSCGFANRSSRGTAHTAMRRRWPHDWGSLRPRCGWTARQNMPWWREARLRFTSGFPPVPTTVKRSGIMPPGRLIVAEAGGVVTDIHGRPLEFHHGRELVANRGVIVSNGRLHATGDPGGRRDRHRPGLMWRSGTDRAGTLSLLACKEREEPATDLPANAVGLPARPGHYLHGGVRLDGRAGRRTDRLARDLAGGGVPRQGAGRSWARRRRPIGGCRLCSGSTASDRALHALCWGGLLLGAAALRRVLARVVRRLALALLSLDSWWRARSFWAISGIHCFLEAGLLAVLMAPWSFDWVAPTTSPGGSPSGWCDGSCFA